MQKQPTPHQQLTLFQLETATPIPVPAVLTPGTTRSRLQKKKLQRKRSYLRHRLKESYAIDTKLRVIELPYSHIEEVPVPDRYYVRQLLRTGFTCKLQLF